MQHHQNFELKKYTSFKIGGTAKDAYFPESVDEFVELLKKLDNPIVLGGMSNVLVASGGVEEPVILTKKLSKFEIIGTQITAQAGAVVPLISKEAAKNSLSGMEFMCGFPATVGGAVYMNASAHKQSTDEIFKNAKVFDRETKSVLKFTKEDMRFAYRSSVMQSGRYVLLEAVFELMPADRVQIENQMSSNQEFRKGKQPNMSTPNCGSVFKNPTRNAAGRLLEEAGAKAFSVGDAVVYENHANFIINSGNATSTDVSQLMKKMYNSVNEKFGIKLVPEVQFVGVANEVELEIWKEFLNEK